MIGVSLGCFLSLTSCNNDNPIPTPEPTPTPEHVWSTTYEYDDVNHWFSCTKENCDLTYKVEAHKFVEDTCSVCGYKKEAENPSTPDNPSTNEETILGITVYDHMQNTRRVTQLLQKVYNVNDTFNTDNLALRVTKRKNREETTENLLLTSVEISQPDMTTPGEKTVTIKYNGVEASYTITVLDLSNVNKEEATVTVNANVAPGVSGNVVTVRTINDAVRVFKLLGTDANTVKTINVAEGVYHEKVEFDLPNINIVGASEDASKTVIEYDLIAAFITPGGTAEYSTDGSASVSIRETALGFHATNITFQNYWNTNSRYEESKIIANNGLSGNTQAVACLVQADKCVFDNVRFSSYHDTLYSQKGRHVYNKCYIEGRTDYIFGDNATSYFNECTISTIGANSDSNGGYIIATRGCQSGAQDSVEYGYVFYKCTITSDKYVKDGTASIARGWADYMTLAFIQCDISAAYSKTAFGTKTDNKNDRYTSMAANPHAELLFEYGNTGAGALTETTPGTIENLCTIISEERAQDFINFDKIFAKVNGNYEYSNAWNGTAGTYVPVTYYFIDYEAQQGVDTNGENHSLFGGAILINGKYRLCGESNGSVQINPGSVITITKPGAVSINWFGGSYGSPANGKITYKNGYATILIVNTEGTPGIYIKSITVDPTQPATHVHEFSDWTVETLPTSETEGLATRVCTDCELQEAYVEEVTLPVLSKDNYALNTSNNAGKTLYTYVKDGVEITFEADSLANVHVHNYGNWTVLDADLPTDTATGKATSKCTDEECNLDDTHIKTIELPVLTDENYVITNNTATTTATGTGTYTITINDVTISFETVTAVLPNIQTYSFTAFSGSYTATEAEPYEIYNGDISIVGGFRFDSVGTQVNKGTVITMKVQGTVTVDWFGGGYGSEADGDIIYKDGCAIITVIGAGEKGNGAYIKNIIVDRDEIPDDSLVLNICVLGENDTTYGTITIVEGKKLTLDKIEEVIPAIYDVDKVYTSSEMTTEFDLTVSVTEDVESIYISVVITSDPITFKFGDYAQNAKPEEFFDGYVTINSSKYWLNGSAIRLSAGDTVVLNIKGELTVTWFGGGYGSELNGTINYCDGYATLTIKDDASSPSGIYIKSITVDGSKEGVHTHEYGTEWKYVCPTLEATGKAYLECSNCELETPATLDVVLPALTDAAYTIVVGTNTATLEAKGTATYVITLDEVKYTFTGETPALTEAHTHNYSTDWTIELPTQTETGLATKTCQTEGCNLVGAVLEIELPNLQDSRYVITNNTATEEAAGTATFTLTVEDVTISFEAATPKTGLTVIESAFTYTYSMGDRAQGDLEASTDYIKFDGCTVLNANYLFFNGSSYIKLNVAPNAQITISGMYINSDNKWCSVAINGTNIEAVNNSATYYSAEGGEIIITAQEGMQVALGSITVEFITVFTESTTVSLQATGLALQGSTGEYEGLTIDATNGKFADNGSGWVQVNNGTIITLNVLEGAQVSVAAYSSADNFTIVTSNGVCTITCTANDYLKSITVKYVYVFKETATVSLQATGLALQGSTGEYEGLTIDATNGKFADNGSGWVQVNNGTIITLNVLEGAQVSVAAYSSADNFTIVTSNGVCTITCTANDYLKSITVKYVYVFKETATVSLQATGLALQGSTGEYEGLTIDATNGKFADNGSGWVQVNNGTIITLNVLEGAQVSVAAYSSADNFTIVTSNGVCTITCTTNDYLKSITVTYSE